MNVLVINCGSSSVKYQVLNPAEKAPLLRGKIERVGEEGRTHADAIAEVLAKAKGLSIDAVGHRVVHGGERFHDATRIDDVVYLAIQACVPLAPLHNPANLAGISAARDALPDVPHVAVFDTSFHARLPRRARTYAIDPDLAKEHGFRRFGFHGTSHAYVAGRAAEHLGRPLNQLRIVSCHLGSGASCAAVELGHSVETSMGMTPLEGLVMGTRSGDLDPGVVLALAKAEGVERADAILNRESGLAGMSGRGKDLRDIENAAAEGDDRARLAIAVFAHRVRKYIGAYAAAMGGVDAVIMTAGIGENSPSMRRRILQRFDFLGLVLDDDANQDAKVDADSPVSAIHADSSNVKVLVVATDEERMIARETVRIAGGRTEVKQPKPIPIAISGRHVHLDRATMDGLFGKGSELSVYKGISQPGQFASEQRVTLVGPRGEIERVRVLGPLRSKPQVEVSRTDEFKLGVDAPIRGSGQVEGSAPIRLVGPEGIVDLKEGLICAWRHVHMTPADAEAYGVEHGDEVEVAVTGGPRDLIFGDVLVRVKESYLLEMHIDTDEANAAELSRGASGALIDEPDTYVTPASGAQAQLRSRR
ncbi:MAG: acetate/propionate family kinase [Deltaproteobacteria bacterium]|nr:MAG: acetate/propionate family kinase [Deltaproteobacteria bacterium]